MNLFLFDFDGTLTTKDTLFEFIKSSTNKPAYYAGLILFSPLFILMILGLLDNEKIKAKFLGYFFKGTSKEEMEKKGQQFVEQKLPALIRKNGIEYLRQAKKKGNHVALVSASLDIWLAPFALKENIQLICTKAGYDEGKYTTSFGSPNCKGAEKVRRVQEAIDVEGYGEIIAFGDSSGDKELLEFAHKGHYRYFH